MKLLRRVHYLLHRRRIEAELAEEMAFHRDLLARDHAGDSAAARRAMGNTTLAGEDARGVWLLPWIESLWQDLVYGLRGMRRQPGFTLVAIAALSIAIGLNTSLFTLFNAVAFRPWPVKDPSRVVSITRILTKGADRGHTAGFGVAEWRYLSEHAKAFQGLLLSGGSTRVEIGSRDFKLRFVSGNMFSVFGLDMARGRGFSPDEDDPLNPQAVAVLNYTAWQNKFGGASDIVGQTLRFDDVPFTIVGVAPEGFSGTAETGEIWAPFSANLLLRPHDKYYRSFLTKPDHCCVQMAGRLAPGVTRDQAAAEIQVLRTQFHAGNDDDGRNPSVVRVSGTALLQANPNDSAKIMPIVGAMFAATTLVLLLACANVGNLLLARAASRHTEIAVRLSLGGTRLRLIRQLLVESMALAAIASLAGLAIGALAMTFAPRLVPDFAILQLSPDYRVYAYTIALAALSCIAFGLAPALHGTRGNIAGAIKSDTAGLRSRFALRSVLLAAQVAISVVLLAGAGLLIRGVQYAQNRDPGYRLDGVNVAQLDLPASAYSGDRQGVFAAELRDALDHAAGISTCASTSDAPMSNARSWTHIRAEGELEDRARRVQVHDVTSEYFDVLTIPVVAGRNFTRPDAERRVVLLNQTAAARFFAGMDPIGKRIISGKDYEVVGVVKDAYTTSLDGVEPTVYFPYSSHSGVPQLLVSGATLASLDRIAATVRAIEPRARVTFTPLAENFRAQLEPARLAATIAGALGILALALASIGMSGVFAYVVRQRTREIGVRMALGARAAQVVWLVLASNLRAVVWGLVVGLAGALTATRILKSMLNGVSPLDPFAYAGVLLLLIVASAAASVLPARRAARVDPVSALRWE
ncbi:MAG TPA: ABC transporter permease [Candidatus Solibacter sp.]|nr:ABC transporter permease [Candidatus Solibacter sp.]